MAPPPSPPVISSGGRRLTAEHPKQLRSHGAIRVRISEHGAATHGDQRTARWAERGEAQHQPRRRRLTNANSTSGNCTRLTYIYSVDSTLAELTNETTAIQAEAAADSNFSLALALNTSKMVAGCEATVEMSFALASTTFMP